MCLLSFLSRLQFPLNPIPHITLYFLMNSILHGLIPFKQLTIKILINKPPIIYHIRFTQSSLIRQTVNLSCESVLTLAN